MGCCVVVCEFGRMDVVYTALQRGKNEKGQDGGWGQEWGRGQEQLLESVFSEERSVPVLWGVRCGATMVPARHDLWLLEPGPCAWESLG